MTHGSIPRDGLMRFSVGIEDKNDLKDDLEKTLAKFL